MTIMPLLLFPLVLLPLLAGAVLLIVLLVQASRRSRQPGPKPKPPVYQPPQAAPSAAESPEEAAADPTALLESLGQALKNRRSQLGMTQEYVAQELGVTRQAVSKWESGASDPSTSNLLALARLYRIPVEELLRQVRN